MRWCKAHKLKIRQWFGEAPRSSGAPSDPFSFFSDELQGGRIESVPRNLFGSMKYMMFMMSLINPSWCLGHANESGIFIGSNIFKLSWLAGIAATATRNQSICPSYSSWEKPVTMSINVNQCHNHSFFRNMQELYCWILCSIFVQSNLRRSNCQVEPVKHSGT